MCQQIGRNLGELVALDVYSNKRRERADRRKLAWRRKPVIAQRPAAINARISRCRRDYRTVALVGIGQANVRTVLNEQSYPLPPMVGCESMKKKSAPGLMTHGTEVPLHAAGCERWSRLAWEEDGEHETREEPRQQTTVTHRGSTGMRTPRRLARQEARRRALSSEGNERGWTEWGCADRCCPGKMGRAVCSVQPKSEGAYKGYRQDTISLQLR